VTAPRNRWIGALVRLYPPAWQARYRVEFEALLADTGVGARQVVDVALAAAAAWARPAARLHDRAARLRTTVGTTLCAWTALAAGAVLFAKIGTDGAVFRTGPAAGWYDGYAVAACLSALAVLVGGLPLAARLVRHHAALLAVPVAAVLVFMGVAAGLARLATVPGGGIGPRWFLVLAGLGVAAGAACAAGPATAVVRSGFDGRALVVAVAAGVGATALMAVATAASIGYAVARHDVGSAALPAYGAVMAVALLIAATSGVRGLRVVRHGR
jgi:hypothetical protein